MQKLYWVHCPELGSPYVCFADEDTRNEDAFALVEELAEDEIFRDGVDWDDVEWEINDD